MQAPSKKEIFHVSGDQHRGVTSGVNLNNSALCKPVVMYRDLFLTLDVYEMPGVPMYIVVRCPLCQMRDPNSQGMDLTIKADQKAIELDPKKVPKFPGWNTKELARELGLQSVNDLRGLLSVEPFKCTWEAEPGLKRDFGFSRCTWSVSIRNNIARDE